MSDCTDTTADGQTIAQQLQSLGPRTVEGDQGRVSMHSVHDAIAAIEYDRKRQAANSKRSMASILRTISGHRLLSHDGRAS